MKCCFCEKEVESIHEAVELGWYPDFWQGDTSYQGPVCPECQEEHLDTGDDGEYELKPGHAVPPAAERLGSLAARKGKSMQPKFELGQIVGTPGALEALEESGQDVAFFLERHSQKDWGEVCEEDKRANDEALVSGERLLSAYRTLKGVRIWVITEAADDRGRRASTTCLTPQKY
jgi:hypothetical protein